MTRFESGLRVVVKPKCCCRVEGMSRYLQLPLISFSDTLQMKLILVNVIRVFALSIKEEKENFLFKVT